MKTFLSISLLFLLTFPSFGQNLVPNPSFEDTVQCPFSFGLEAYVMDWKSARETPDYFNTCATAWIASVPTNDYGYQQAYSGNAYIGLLTYRSDSSLYTEAAGVQLTQPLIIGQKYYISFKISLALEISTGSMAATNKLGVQFSTVEYSPSSPSPINNFAHVWTDSIITDTVNWSTVKGSFVADSAYGYLSSGNFFDKPFVDSIIYGAVYGAYYYFDDVCVSSDSLECYQLVSVKDTDHSMTSFSIYPNPVTDYFTINHSLFNENYDITIYNTLGQKLYEEKNISTDRKTINTATFNKGLLLINIKSNNQQFLYKLLKR